MCVVFIEMDQRERKRLILLIVYITLTLTVSKVTYYEEGYVHRDEEYLSPEDKTHIGRIVISSIQTRGFNYKQQYHELLLYQKALYPCIKNPKEEYDAVRENYLGLCGTLYVSETLTRIHRWFSLKVFAGAYISIDVIHFDLPWETQGCMRHGMVIVLPGNDSRLLDHCYCGRRMPWNMMYRQNTVHIGIYGKRISIYMRYFAQYNTSISEKVLAYLGRGNVKYGSPPFQVSFEQKKNKYLNEIIIYSPSLDKVIIWFCLSNTNLSESLDKLDMFDGPGKYSQLILSTNLTGCSTRYTSTGAIVSIDYYQKESSLDVTYGQMPNLETTAIIQHEESHTFYSASTISTNKRTVIKLLTPNKQGIISSRLGYERVIVPVLHVNKVVFRGPSQFDGYGGELCQYGGLFVYKTVGLSSALLKEICSDERKAFLPYVMTPEDTWMVVILWYSGYTSGYISGITELTRCAFSIQDQWKQLDSNYIFPPHAACLNLYIAGYNKSYELVLSTTKGSYLGPMDFNFQQHDNEHSEQKCSGSFKFVECFSDAAGSSTRHRPSVLRSSWNSTVFAYPLLSSCIIKLTAKRVMPTCSLLIIISRRLCIEKDSPTFPHLLIGSERYCNGKFGISKIPKLYLSSVNGSAYSVNISSSFSGCDENLVIEIQDRRNEILHYYRVISNKPITLLLTQAKITLKATELEKILTSCMVVITIKKNIVLDSTEKMSLLQDWSSRTLSFVPRRYDVNEYLKSF